MMAANEDLSTMSGSALRERLEKALADNRQLQSENSGLKAGSFLQEKGMRHLKPEDLAGVDPDEWETVAPKLEEKRAGEALEATRRVLAERGLGDDEITALMSDGDQKPEAQGTDDWSRAREVQGIAGSPVPLRQERAQNLHGRAAIEAGLSG